MANFNELGLSPEILKVLEELGFEKPTDIQAQAIPPLMRGQKDIIGLAQTGTGKTAAFGLPLIDFIDPNLPFTQALILAPTRELGKQIAEQITIFGKYKKRTSILAVYGGAPIHVQLRALKKPTHIIIATPGRLRDLINRKAVHLDQLKCLVLDEADEMLNMGFKEELDEILTFCPSEKKTWLFSATMPKTIKSIVDNYMDNPLEIKINQSQTVNVNISHLYTVVNAANKLEAMKRFLDMQADMRGVVFCRTKRDTQDLAENLLKFNYRVDALHGDLTQAHRDRVMKRFKSKDLQVLIATDVAARGIDVNDLSHVFHYSLPDELAYYTHRSGRTARAGKKGVSISFINGREQYRINRLERNLGITFKKVLIPATEDIARVRVKKWCQGIVNHEINDAVTEDLLSRAKAIFGNVTKDEIIAKLLSIEIERLKLTSNKDLNSDLQSSRGDGRGRGDRGGRGRGGRGDRGRSRGRRYDDDRGGRSKRRSSTGSGKYGSKRRSSSSRDGESPEGNANKARSGNGSFPKKGRKSKRRSK